MLRAAVLGFPISHSLSPAIHGFWLKHYHIKGEYHAIEIEADKLFRKLDRMVREGYSGCNITIPHKEAVIEWAKSKDALIEDEALLCGAANTLIFRHNKVHLRNTDIEGFYRNIEEALKTIPKKKAMVLGAGGASRAILYALIEYAKFEEVLLSNRTQERAEIIRDHIKQYLPDAKITIVPWEEREAALEDVNLLANTTALGMEGGGTLELSLDALPKDSVVTDIVYKPLHTQLLKDAAARGNTVVTGIGMLLHQAVPGFEKWFGVRPEVTPELEKHIEPLL